MSKEYGQPAPSVGGWHECDRLSQSQSTMLTYPTVEIFHVNTGPLLVCQEEQSTIISRMQDNSAIYTRRLRSASPISIGATHDLAINVTCSFHLHPSCDDMESSIRREVRVPKRPRGFELCISSDVFSPCPGFPHVILKSFANAHNSEAAV